MFPSEVIVLTKVQLSCNSTGSGGRPAGTGYTWFMDGNILKNTFTASVIELYPDTIHYEGNYSCAATNVHGNRTMASEASLGTSLMITGKSIYIFINEYLTVHN